MHQRKRGFIVRILQIRVKLPQLIYQKHTLIYNGAAGKRRHIGIIVGLFKYPAHQIEPSVKFQPARRIGRPLEKGLFDAGHFGKRLLPQHLGPCWHAAPAQKLHALFFYNDLEHLFCLAAAQRILRKEEHPYPVIPCIAQRKAKARHGFLKKAVRYLQQNAHTVTRLPLGVFPGPMLQLFYDLQRIVHRLVALAAMNIHHRANAAGVVLKARVVERRGNMLFVLFHFKTSFRRMGLLTDNAP